MGDAETLIMVVEDDDELRKYVEHVLRSNGFATLAASNGVEALSQLEQHNPSLVVLDLMMPKMDGLETCQEIRRRSALPIIVLSALGDEQRKVTALEEGADDYVTKPFGAAELVARIRAVMRRVNYLAEPPSGPPRLRVGPLEIDLEGNSVLRDGAPLRLTRTELGLIKVLAQHIGKVVDHRTLLQRVWGPEYGEESAYLHVYMGRLRRKLEEDPANPRFIVTEPGIGYRLVTNAEM